jgi:uncharacterized protein YbjT (DUF2867 family)
MILVTGATGHVGAQVVRDLAARGKPVKAFVRDAERARAMLGEDVELAVGDFSDADSLHRAMVDVDRLFLSSADGPQKVADETAVIDAAAGARLIVKASTVMAEAGSPLPCFDWHGQIEAHLRTAPVPSVILQSGFYMTNLLAAAEQVRSVGKLFAPAGRGTIAMIDPRDVGRVGAAVLTSDGHEGRTYVLTGSEAISYEQVAEALTAATGRPVEYMDVPEEAMMAGLAESGAPDWLSRHLVGAFRLVRSDVFTETTDVVRVVALREPKSFADFAREFTDQFAAGAAVTAV